MLHVTVVLEIVNVNILTLSKENRVLISRLHVQSACIVRNLIEFPSKCRSTS